MQNHTSNASLQKQPPRLSREQAQRSVASLNREAARRLTDEDLSAELNERLITVHMYEMDIQLGGSGIPPHILQNGIAYELHWVELLTREMNRRMHTDRAPRSGTRDLNALSDQQIAAVRALDIVAALQSLGVELRKGSREWYGRCPLHDDSSPSFSVNQINGLWHCFGRCNTGGDLLTFLEMRFSLGFVEAVHFAESLLPVAEAA